MGDTDKKQDWAGINALLGGVGGEWLANLGRVDPDECMRQLRGMMTADELEELWGKMEAIGNKPIGEDLGRIK